jgi:hypothetical protein
MLGFFVMDYRPQDVAANATFYELIDALIELVARLANDVLARRALGVQPSHL